MRRYSRMNVYQRCQRHQRLFWSFRSNILLREGFTTAKRKAKERSGGKVTRGGIQSQEQMESEFTHNPPSPWHDKDNCPSPPPPLSPAPPLPPPPPLGSYPILDTRRPQRWISVTDSVRRLWVQKLILVSDGDCFLLLPFFYRTPVSRDIDCENQWNLGGHQYFDNANIYASACWAGTIKPVLCGRESADISRAASGNSKLGDCSWRVQHLQGEVGEHQRGLREVSCCGLCRAKTVRRCFRACTNIWSTPRFCRCQYFVDANILSTPIFCRHQYFVDASILWTPLFCRRHYFVDATILSTPLFCQRQYFVNANILSTPIFCQRQCFVDTNILTAPIFCRCQYFVTDNILSVFRFQGWLFVEHIIYDCVLCISWLLLICLNLLRFRPLDTCWSLLWSQ